MLSIVFLGVVLSVLAGCVPTTGMKLNLAPQSETDYKVVLETGKDYSFVQPSINKTKERHSVGRVEMVFAQKVESVDQKGDAIADITIKELKYLSEDPQGKTLDFNSTAEGSKSDPLFALIGQSYKIKIAPDGKVEVIDAGAAREVIKQEGSAKKFADRLFSNEEVEKRHQVLALFDANQCLCEKDKERNAKAVSSNKKPSKSVNKRQCKKGDSWSMVSASPAGMLTPKSFEKVYTLTDIKEQNGQKIAIVTMNAEPSSKRAANLSPEETKAQFFAKMFEEKDNYTGKMVLNLTTGEINSYQELLKAEWLAVESPKEQQKSDKDPDQLIMGFWSLYSIEKVD
jgi:hypothetical protein